MGQARLTAGLFAVAALMAPFGVMAPFGAAWAQGRFLSYGSEGECTAGRVLSAAVCRTAFANARAEFEARTTAFPSRARCEVVYRSCAPWPPGTGAATTFRPSWDGVDIVDTAGERSATPVAARAVRKIAFAPTPLTAAPPSARSLTVRPSGRGRAPAGSAGPSDARRSAGTSLDPGAPPPPGSGFKLEDGVLTFPAPARFQPKNLPKTR